MPTLGGKCFIFFFHKGTTVLVWYLHVVLLLSVHIVVYMHTVPENKDMGVFGMYCTILAKLSRIANSIIVPIASYLTAVSACKHYFKWLSDSTATS